MALATYGWAVLDVVKFTKEWCYICTKASMREVYGPHSICFRCGTVETKQEATAQ